MMCEEKLTTKENLCAVLSTEVGNVFNKAAKELSAGCSIVSESGKSWLPPPPPSLAGELLHAVHLLFCF